MQANLPDYLANLPALHRDKPKFAATVKLLSGYYADCAKVAASIPGLYDLDNAAGVQLDAVGQWVGQSRNIPGVVVGAFFGFLIGTGAEGDPSGVAYPTPTPFGEEGSFDTAWGPWYESGSLATPNITLDDPTYKRILRARIIRNTVNSGAANQWGGVSGYLLQIANIVFPGGTKSLSYGGARVVTVYLGRALTPLETAIIAATDIFPRAAGIQLIVTT